MNIMEDGYIEGKMLNRYPGVLGSNLAIMRKDYFENTNTLTQLIEYESEENGHIWFTLETLLLSYAKYGEIKYGEEPLTDKRIKLVFSLLTDIDTAVTDSSAKERWNVVNIIMIRCWEHAKDFIEYYIEKADEAIAAGGGMSADEMLTAALAKIVGVSAEATGDTAPIDEPAGSAEITPSKKKRGITAKIAAKIAPPEPETEKEDDEPAAKTAEDDADKKDESEDESKEKSESEDKSEEKPEGTASETNDEEETETPSFSGMIPDDESPVQEVSAEEDGRIPLEQTDDIFNPHGESETEFDDEYEGSGYENAASDIDRLLENMAERSVLNEFETERKSYLNELAQNIAYGDIHKGVKTKIHRVIEVSDSSKESYHNIAEPLLRISTHL